MWMGKTLPPDQVYDAIRDDLVPTTAQVPMETFLATFRKYASLGKDCLYLSFHLKCPAAAVRHV